MGSRHEGTKARRHGVVSAALALAVFAVPAPAQQQVGSGHTLDNNLRLGSGGYNDVRSGGGAPRESYYRVRYSTTNPRLAWQDHFNAFQEERYWANHATSGPTYRGPRRGGGGGLGGQEPVIIESGGSTANAPPVNADSFPVYADEQVQLISYGVGYYLGKELAEGLKRDGIDAEIDMIIQGFTDGLKGNTPKVAPEDLDEILHEVHLEMKRRAAKRLLAEDPKFKQEYEANLAEARALQEDFGKQEGVVTLPEGIQYLVLVPGEGPSPGPTDIVRLNARATLPDGTEIGRWQGVEVQVDDTIMKGSEVLLPLMKVHGKWKAIFPPDMAFGEAGRPPDIGPNKALVIEVELLGIKPPE